MTYLKELVLETQQLGASDLHLVSNVPPVIRLHGSITALERPALSPSDIRDMLFEILTEEQKQALETDWQACFSRSMVGQGYCRFNLYFHRRRLEAAIRIGAAHQRTIAELGLPSVVAEMTSKSNGLLLITGPTGSGKTTSFNAIIDHINRERRVKIVTVEDPIEYLHSNNKSIIVQQEVHTDVKSFSGALVHILRQDPDIIGIGEMRDLETISTALTAAETGHLVVATLHTNDASRTINRIIDAFPAEAKNHVRSQLAGSLIGILSQELIPRIDGKSRILAYETLVATEAVRNIIRDDKIHTLPNIILTCQRYGMQLMDRCLLEYYQKGIISLEAALSIARDAQFFKAGCEITR